MWIGEQGELLYEQYLLNEQPWPFHRELAFKSEIDGVVISGRVDFITYHNGYRVIHENKTSESKNFLYGVIRKGEPKLNHLSQILFYLSVFGETRAKLIALYYPKMEQRIFKIEVQPDGRVLIDGRLSQYSIQAQIAHQLLSAKVIKEQVLLDRPLGKGACTYCDHKDVCDAWDTGQFKDVTALAAHFNNLGG